MSIEAITYRAFKRIWIDWANKLNIVLLIVLPSLLFVSCENETAKINKIASTEEVPSGTAEGFEMLVSDSTIIRFKMQTPELIKHDNEKDPYTEFPKGVKIIKYDANMNIVSSITCLYAKHFDTDDRWEAKNNVVAVNLKGDTLKTEYLVWDNRKAKIYSDQFVKIIKKDEIMYGTSFESNLDFSDYQTKNLKGTMYINVDK